MTSQQEDWKAPVLSSLKERDLVEKGDNELFTTFATLYERLDKAESMVEKLKSGDIQNELQKTVNDNERLRQLVRDQKDHSIKLESEITKLRNKNQESSKEIIKLNKIVTKLTDKLNSHSEEYQSKNKSIELLNDEFLSLGIQNNLLYDKLGKLEKEHNDLIERWMLKVKEDADKMNETNAFLNDSR